ncbi:MAG: PHP domain-containing protein [Dehalococcoidales bacterium]|nr:PHP domain-containing protein [Dehalococcoidales bacterium]
MVKVDLHLHSSVSDGVLSPVELVEKAAELGLSAIALTDHDNVDGIPPAMKTANKYPSLVFIPGIEISTDTRDREVHMLGYYIDHTDAGLLEALERMRQARVTRAMKMVERLSGLGVKIEWDRVRELAGEGTVGRPHVAQALLEKGHIGTIQEAFTRYLAFGGPAYVPRMKMTPQEAIGMILQARGIPVLAHPLTKQDKNIGELVGELAAAGLAGLEAYYKEYPEEDRQMLAKMAEKHGLITTGGSDFHGLKNNNEVMMGEAGVPPRVVDELEALAKKMRLETGV